MGAFLDPKNDFAFKRLFGVEKNKNILIKFLNDVFAGVHPHIEDVEFLKTSQDPEIAAMRQSIVDVICKDSEGHQFIIEMQCASDTHFLNRAKAYACRAYLNQRKKNEKPKSKSQKSDGYDYADMKHVIFLAILNKTLFPNKERYLSHHKHLDIETFENDVEGLSFSFLELEKMQKTEIHELSNDIERWMHFFKYAPSTELSELKEIGDESPAILDAYKALAEYAFSHEELLEYERYGMKQDEIETSISDARAEGLAEGLAEGKAEGLAEGELKKARETAIKMLENELPLDLISKCTGLSATEIKKLNLERLNLEK